MCVRTLKRILLMVARVWAAPLSALDRRRGLLLLLRLLDRLLVELDDPGWRTACVCAGVCGHSKGRGK